MQGECVLQHVDATFGLVHELGVHTIGTQKLSHIWALTWNEISLFGNCIIQISCWHKKSMITTPKCYFYLKATSNLYVQGNSCMWAYLSSIQQKPFRISMSNIEISVKDIRSSKWDAFNWRIKYKLIGRRINMDGWEMLICNKLQFSFGTCLNMRA